MEEEEENKQNNWGIQK